MGINADKCCCCCYTLLVVMAVSLSPLNHPLVCAGGVDLTSSDSFDGMSGIALDDNLQANQSPLSLLPKLPAVTFSPK